MRRSRAFVGFGWVLVIVALAVFTRRSQAADAPQSAGAPVVVAPPAEAFQLELLPPLALARRDSRLPGSLFQHDLTSLGAPLGESCPPEMVEVEGDYCPYLEQTCLRWLDPDTRLRCAEFARTPGPSGCSMKARHQRFCIDRYEWPNQVGALPHYMASWNDAKASCEAAGKRLCSDTEWTLACEGPDRRPYPYGDGYARDDRACNIDKPYIWPHPEKIFDAKEQSEELARLDQREPSGSRSACVSPYGVHDMVGNVDEWVVNESQAAKPFRSGLKGGYWGPVRTRCRPMTTAHDESFRYYQIGFRCCGAAGKGEVGPGGPSAPMAGR